MLGENSPQFHSAHHKSPQSELGLNPGRWNGKLTSSRLCHGTAAVIIERQIPVPSIISGTGAVIFTAVVVARCNGT
jgi:hypothetical protein